MDNAEQYHSEIALARRAKRAERNHRRYINEKAARDRLSVGDVVVYAVPPLRYGTIIGTCKLTSAAELCGHTCGATPIGFRVRWASQWGNTFVTHHHAFDLRSVAKYEAEGFDD